MNAAEGSAQPLGATWCEHEKAWNFALYSEHACAVRLLLYGVNNVAEPILSYSLDHLRNKTGPIWHCRIAAESAPGARYYAYSISGPTAKGRTDRDSFVPKKLLLDPYATAIFFPPTFDRKAACGAESNAGKAALGVLPTAVKAYDWGEERRPRHTHDTVIYELHVRGFTRSESSGVDTGRRGTYLGLIDKIPYLKHLGVTVVELMPVFQFDPQDGNYWGYMPISFFAAHRGYSAGVLEDSAREEFREMVRAFHAADIEVILDVVYNHTAEGDESGPTYSYKGIDNSNYYILTEECGHVYADFSGTGNTLKTASRYVRKLIVDSLRYWVREMHVDGFRFDLASVLARGPDGALNSTDPPIFGDILCDPELAKIRLIAEPWDAAGAYQLGHQFPGTDWLQWNGKFRDDMRRFVRGDCGMVGALMQRLYGSDDLFPDSMKYSCRPYQSVNFITSHDGFTLYDLVSYNKKNNLANGHDDTDGASENYSWNCGVEGEEGVSPAIRALRLRQVKNFCALLFLANGTPMLRAGDEFLQTQGGNNNPYNQDTAVSWLDWNLLRKNKDIFRFFRSMIHFRSAHPTLSRNRFWREDVRWYGSRGAVDLGHESRTLAVYIDGASQRDVNLYIMINGSEEPVEFENQVADGGDWRLIFDTGLNSPEDFPESSARIMLQSKVYRVAARSIAMIGVFPQEI